MSRREDHGSHTEADAGRFERAHAEPEPRDREYVETWPPAWIDPDLRAESDALWGGARKGDVCPTEGCAGDARYAAPGRHHREGCTYPLGGAA